jgi:hypothetical protein
MLKTIGAWQKILQKLIRPLNKTQETRLPVSEGEVEDATQAVADAPAYVLGSSPTAAGEIAAILDRGVYPTDDDQIHESHAVLDHNDESGTGSNTDD